MKPAPYLRVTVRQPGWAPLRPPYLRSSRLLRKLVLLVAASLLGTHLLAAQTRAADSLRTLLRTAPRPDTVRARRLQLLAEELVMSNLGGATTARPGAIRSRRTRSTRATTTAGAWVRCIYN
ncbi:MAG: hypothetical protein EOO62_15845 [Hymenobacter sp.]|nr:MAG: hypothetical protein EOO62_15845 [Hymenobacter sp.]